MIVFDNLATLIIRGTTSTSTAHTFYGLFLLQLTTRYSAYAGAVEVGLLGLNAAKTAKL